MCLDFRVFCEILLQRPFNWNSLGFLFSTRMSHQEFEYMTLQAKDHFDQVMTVLRHIPHDCVPVSDLLVPGITDFCTVITDFCTVITDFCYVVMDFCTVMIDFCTIVWNELHWGINQSQSKNIFLCIIINII